MAEKPKVFVSRRIPDAGLARITAACDAEVWPDPLPPAQQGVPYSFTLTASGGNPPYTFAITSGALPAGLSLNGATGVISGTPTGTMPSLLVVTFSVTDTPL